MRRVLLPALILLVAAPYLQAQIQIRPLAPPLRPYTACHLTGGPDLVEITPLITPNSTRAIQTLHGQVQIKVVDGARLLFSYPGTDGFANVRAEELSAENFDESKKDLISNFDKLLSADEFTQRNYSLPSTMHGFEIYGFDRTRLEGVNLGIYLFIDSETHVAATVYFLNADPSHRKFATMEEYSGYRDQFLSKYTACLRSKIAPAPQK